MTANPRAIGATHKLKLILDGERPVSWNTFYAGTHWRKRSEIVRDVHLAVKAALMQNGRVPPFEEPVTITITSYFKGRQLDPDNITGKLYIDALVHEGVLHNDTPRYVDAVTTRSRKDKERPRVVIDITQA